MRGHNQSQAFQTVPFKGVSTEDPMSPKQNESPLGKRHPAPKVPSSKVVLITGFRAKKSAVKDSAGCSQLAKATSQEGKIKINTERN